jgi:excisionase family DNA binding protein
MNDSVLRRYSAYLDHTGGDRAAAAALALAETLEAHRPAAVELPVQPMTVPEVAKFLRVRPNKVLSWIRSGRLRGYNIAERETGRPKYRVNPEDLRTFTQTRATTQPAPKGRPPGRRIPVIPMPRH